jgi:hypothetical protein
MITRLRGLESQVAEVIEFADGAAFRLSERRAFASPAIGRSTPVPLSQVRAAASDRGDDLFSAFDDDRDTRWFTGRRQRGDEWVRIEFRRPLRIEGIRLMLSERTLGDYPRSLTVVSIDQNGRETTIRQGPVLAELARGLLADGESPWMEIALEVPGPSKSILLRQRGTTRSWYWSVHEIQVMESAGDRERR